MQLGTTNIDKIELNDQKITNFDVAYWSMLISELPLTVKEKANLAKLITDNAEYIPKWRRAMASIKEQKSEYDHSLLNIITLNLSISRLKTFDGTELTSLEMPNFPSNQLQIFNGNGLTRLKRLDISKNPLR